MNEAERLQILEMIEKGVITASEGVRLLNSLEGEPDETEIPLVAQTNATSTGQTEAAPQPEVFEQDPASNTKTTSPSKEFDSRIKKWRSWWWIPLSVGIGITVISGLFMYLAYQASGFGFWFACLWFPFLFGIIVISLSAASRTARWMHVRIHQEPGEWPQTIAISMPLPIRFAAWIMRIFKPHIHGIDNANLDEMILALEKTSPEQPLYVQVDEGDSGEKVEVYIG
jgi:hypothetical protein